MIDSIKVVGTSVLVSLGYHILSASIRIQASHHGEWRTHTPRLSVQLPKSRQNRNICNRSRVIAKNPIFGSPEIPKWNPGKSLASCQKDYSPSRPVSAVEGVPSLTYKRVSDQH